MTTGLVYREVFIYAGADNVKITGELFWLASDPAAMNLTFCIEDKTTWTFARSLLLAGLKESVGEGDIKFSPLIDSEGVVAFVEGFLTDQLTGEVLAFLLPRVDVEELLAVVEDIIPSGEEEYWELWADDWEQLLTK